MSEISLVQDWWQGPTSDSCVLATTAPFWFALAFILVALFALLSLSQFVGVWIQANMSGVRLAFTDIIGMRLRGFDCRKIVLGTIRAHRMDLPLTVADLEAHQNLLAMLEDAHNGDLRIESETSSSGQIVARATDRAGQVWEVTGQTARSTLVDLAMRLGY